MVHFREFWLLFGPLVKLCSGRIGRFNWREGPESGDAIGAGARWCVPAQLLLGNCFQLLLGNCFHGPTELPPPAGRGWRGLVIALPAVPSARTAPVLDVCCLMFLIWGGDFFGLLGCVSRFVSTLRPEQRALGHYQVG